MRFILFLLFYGFTCGCFADSEAHGYKIYIQPEQLTICNEGMFIFIGEEQFLVEQLHCDAQGIYCFLDRISDR